MKLATLAFALFGSLGIAAALSACSTTDNISDCHAICDKYKDCFDSSYDTGACYNRCRDDSSSDKNFEHDVDVCRACIDGQSCSATFACAGDCGSIVP